MYNKMVFGYERDPLMEYLDGILYFSEKELEVAQLIGNCRSDKDIVQLLRINEEELNDIKRRIREQTKLIVRGY